MPLGPLHKARTRERIVAAAGAEFRRRGALAPSVSELMAAAGLTHGGFYAHFESKAALLAEVLATDHGLVRQLARRPAGRAQDWETQTQRIFADYLAPAHLQAVASGCSFAALAAEAARADAPAREGFAAAWRRALGELLRRPGERWRHALQRGSAAERANALLALSTAIGAVQQACAVGDDALAGEILRAAAAQVRQLLRRCSARVAAVPDEAAPSRPRVHGAR
jgi:TetR/AcrR family transcriptional regulator, transcriptional repressor for nem operon